MEAQALSQTLMGDDDDGLVFRDVLLEDCSAVAELYAQAFRNNPSYCSIFQKDRGSADHIDSLTWLMKKRCEIFVSKRSAEVNPVVFTLCENCEGEGDEKKNKILVGAIAYSPVEAAATIWDHLLHGIALWPFQFGFASLQRALSLGDKLDNIVAQKNLQPSAEIHMMAVKPGLQGRRIGTRLISSVLKEVDAKISNFNSWRKGGAEKKNVILLQTQLKINVTFYQRFGFKEIAEEKTPIDWPEWKRGPATADTSGDAIAIAVAEKEIYNDASTEYSSFYMVRETK